MIIADGGVYVCVVSVRRIARSNLEARMRSTTNAFSLRVQNYRTESEIAELECNRWFGIMGEVQIHASCVDPRGRFIRSDGRRQRFLGQSRPEFVA